jgi:2-C-methyl-D-erythritol 4-phosphate cytidylyltransferase
MNYAVILLAGSGQRFGGNTPKQFVEVAGKPLCYYSISAFQRNVLIDQIILVIQKEYYPQVAKIVVENNLNKVKFVVLGGKTRKESTHNAINYLASVAKDDDIVLIHDGDRPLVDDEIIEKNIEMAKENGACTTAIPANDTIIMSNDAKLINEVPSRKYCFQVQTPQSFKFKIIKEAHINEIGDENVTDDAQLVLKISHPVYLVIGKRSLLKVTTKEDLDLIKALISQEY